jgi:LAS superfamily LD-carboxypeptidase LdcB
MKVIQDSYYLWRDKTRPATQYQVRTAVHDPLDTMAKEFYHRFKSPLRINSARRSYHEQQNRFSAACFAEGLCAFPGTSEHQN